MYKKGNNKLKVRNDTFFKLKRKKMENENENRIVFRTLDFEPSDISEIEIKYSRHVVNKLIELQDFIGEFDIRTNPEELRKFIIHVVRGYEAFNNNLVNHFPEFKEMEELNGLIPETKSKSSGVPVNEDPLKEIKLKYSRQTKTYPPTEWWDWDND